MTELQQKCLNLAEEICKEINGDMNYVPEEDVQECLQNLTEDNLQEIAFDLAELAYWFNYWFN
jgi:hypothetical protein